MHIKTKRGNRIIRKESSMSKADFLILSLLHNEYAEVTKALPNLSEGELIEVLDNKQHITDLSLTPNQLVEYIHMLEALQSIYPNIFKQEYVADLNYEVRLVRKRYKEMFGTEYVSDVPLGSIELPPGFFDNNDSICAARMRDIDYLFTMNIDDTPNTYYGMLVYYNTIENNICNLTSGKAKAVLEGVRAAREALGE